jgi:hypothetical protein
MTKYELCFNVLKQHFPVDEIKKLEYFELLRLGSEAGAFDCSKCRHYKKLRNGFICYDSNFYTGKEITNLNNPVCKGLCYDNN